MGACMRLGTVLENLQALSAPRRATSGDGASDDRFRLIFNFVDKHSLSTAIDDDDRLRLSSDSAGVRTNELPRTFDKSRKSKQSEFRIQSR